MPPVSFIFFAHASTTNGIFAKGLSGTEPDRAALDRIEQILVCESVTPNGPKPFRTYWASCRARRVKQLGSLLAT